MLLGILSAGLPLSACSRHSLPSDEFKILHTSSQTSTRDAALAQAKQTCEKEVHKRGIASIVSIFRHLRPGATQRDYAECMKSHGFDPNAPDAAFTVSANTPPATQQPATLAPPKALANTTQ